MVPSFAAGPKRQPRPAGVSSARELHIRETRSVLRSANVPFTAVTLFVRPNRRKHRPRVVASVALSLADFFIA